MSPSMHIVLKRALSVSSINDKFILLPYFVQVRKTENDYDSDQLVNYMSTFKRSQTNPLAKG